jgi:hypothetical protein
MTAPVVTEGFVVRLPDGSCMLIFDKWSQFNAGREGHSGGGFLQFNFHAPMIAHGRVAIISKQGVSCFILVIDQTSDKYPYIRRGQLHFSLRTLGYFFKQGRTNTQPSEFWMDAAIGFKLIVTILVIEFFTTNQASIPGFRNKNVALHIEAFVFPLVCQFFSGKHKKRIAFGFRNIVTEFCHSVEVCPTGSTQGQARVEISYSSHCGCTSALPSAVCNPFISPLCQAGKRHTPQTRCKGSTVPFCGSRR